jgi:hypothetical protein
VACEVAAIALRSVATKLGTMTTLDHPTTRRAGDRLDAHGAPLTGSADAVDRYDRAIDLLLRFHPDVVSAMTDLDETHPTMPMGQALVAYLHLMSTDADDLDTARVAAGRLASSAAHPRELAHADAVSAWVGGNWHLAASVLDDLLVRWPTDLLALMIGHQLDFFVGDAGNLRDRVGRSLGVLDETHPHHGFVLGMQSFGLEEAGHYGAAEEAGLAALAANRDDVWAVHAVTHVREMQGRVDEGIAFLREREADWGSGNLFTVHNWWHLALFHLEAEQPASALRIYDAEVHHAASAGVPIEMLDASALLWRLHLDGEATADRAGALADAWAAKVESEPWYAFNEAHAVMAMVMAGRTADGRRIVERVRRWLDGAPGDRPSNVDMSARVGLPVSDAVLAFGEGRYGDVVDTLLPVRRGVHVFGGSHAQRDAVQRTLVVAAQLAGRSDLAAALVRERLALRESNVWAWRQRAAIARAAGDEGSAATADATAAGHAARFAAAGRRAGSPA